MVDALISIAREKLVELAKGELKLLCGAGEEADKLLARLETIQSYMHDAGVRQFNEPEVEVWLQKLKYVAYEADDVLDEWQAKSHQLSTGTNPVWNFFATCLYLFAQCICFDQLALSHSVGKKIQKINGKLDHIDNLSKKFNFLKSTTVMGEGTNFPRVIRNARETTSSKDDLFGREAEISYIKDKLINSTSETSKLPVVSILGPPGFGKTALAKYVFNDDEIVQHFKEQIWVCVSDEFDIASIMKKIIEAATRKAPSAGGLEALQKIITDEVLKGKLFLLVLDDVWNEEYGKWEKLFNVIKNCGLSGSRIVVTTRSENVCKVIGGHIFPLRSISSFEHCWSIFESVAFVSIDESKCRELRMVGEEIVNKCKGVPLAIKTVAGALRTKRTKTDWENVLKSNMWDWQPKFETGILPALLLSYYHLSPHLKQCFRYCAIYPKDYNISKDKIVPQWIAHGYISEKKDTEMEDVAGNYFDELVARSLLQEPEFDKYDNIMQCKMHDLVHELALFVTKGEFLHVSNEENIKFDTQYPPLHCTISDIGSLNNIKIDMLRTFISAESYKREVGFQIEEMQHLRVLKVSKWSLEIFPVVGKLVHLRYLNLPRQIFKALPSSIGELQNLLYLKLTKNVNLKALPSTIGRLTNLRKLDLSGTGLDEIPDCIGKLASLQVLDVSDCENLEKLPESIKDLSHLQVLDVSYCSKLEKLPKSIKDLSRLQVLNVAFCEKLEQLPDGIFAKMTGLKQLSIYGSGLRGLPAGIGKLTCLQRLENFWVAGNHDGSSSSCSSSSSNIWELGDLDHLHGLLCIHNLDMVTSGEEATRAQLHNKTSISWLALEWGTDGRGGAKEKTTSEDVLQALRPCPTLHELDIDGYPGCTVPMWLGNSTALMLSGLQDLTLDHWDGCTNLPALGNLPELQRLNIVGMPKVRRVGAEWFGSNHAFPKLEELRFRNMAEWEEWDILEEKLFFHFPCLGKLHITDCPKLRSLPPIFSTSLQEIDLDECPNLSNWLGILPASIVTLESISAEWINEMPSLPNLEDLKIRGDGGVSELSYDLVNKLGTLKTLDILICPNLESLPQEMASLKQLQELRIRGCPKLKESCNKDGAQWYKIQHIPHIEIDYQDVRRNA